MPDGSVPEPGGWNRFVIAVEGFPPGATRRRVEEGWAHRTPTPEAHGRYLVRCAVALDRGFPRKYHGYRSRVDRTRAVRHASLPRKASMPQLISSPMTIEAAGNIPKTIEEFVGLANTGEAAVSIARMTSAGGWREPGQRPEFLEISVVLRGLLRVEHSDGDLEVRSGQAVVARPGEWVRYSTPDSDGAEYIAICMPAFSPETVHRDE